MKRTRITESITFLEPEDMRLFQACAGVMVEGDRKLVIDANMGPETAAFLEAENPDIAVISHYHLDHGVWGATAQKHAHAQVWVPTGEERYLTNLGFFLEHTAAPHGLAAEWKDFSVVQCGYQELDECTPYEPGPLFSDRNVVIECIDTRGHSPAHRSFYFPEDKVLFTGDLGIDRFEAVSGSRHLAVRAEEMQLHGATPKSRSAVNRMLRGLLFRVDRSAVDR